MAEIRQKVVSKLLDEALALSPEERSLLSRHLIASLDEGPYSEAVDDAWAEEFTRRVDDFTSGRAGAQLLAEFAKRLKRMNLPKAGSSPANRRQPKRKGRNPRPRGSRNG